MTIIKCTDCNGTVSTKASSCPHCGAPTSIENSSTEKVKLKKKPGAKRSIVGGFIFMTMGVAIYFWAQQHNPNIGFGEAVMRMGSDHWVLNRNFYDKVLAFCILSSVGGFLSIIQGLLIQAKNNE